MVPHLFVIDDFLRNAEQVRAEALTLNYSITGQFPGLNSVEKINIEGVDQVISALVREPVRRALDQGLLARQLSSGAGQGRPAGRIHIDQSHWSGILYLTRDEDCRGGTQFFRHKRTRTDRVPMDVESLKRIGYSSYEEMQHDILDKDALDHKHWEHTMTVPMRFNRLILLQPHYWHTSGNRSATASKTGGWSI